MAYRSPKQNTTRVVFASSGCVAPVPPKSTYHRSFWNTCNCPKPKRRIDAATVRRVWGRIPRTKHNPQKTTRNERTCPCPCRSTLFSTRSTTGETTPRSFCMNTLRELSQHSSSSSSSSSSSRRQRPCRDPATTTTGPTSRNL